MQKITVKELIVRLQEIVENDEVLVASELGAVADKEVVNVAINDDGTVVLECRDVG